MTQLYIFVFMTKRLNKILLSRYKRLVYNTTDAKSTDANNLI